MFEVDELDIYRGGDIEITPKIIVTQPTLGQIADFGEKRYFNAVYTLTAVGADLKWQLWDLEQIDYTKNLWKIKKNMKKNFLLYHRTCLTICWSIRFNLS